jgi:hypothetical protein
MVSVPGDPLPGFVSEVAFVLLAAPILAVAIVWAMPRVAARLARS